MAASTSTNDRYVWWVWMRDDELGFTPYSPEDSCHIEKVYCSDRKGKVKLEDCEIDLREKTDSKGRKIHRKTNIFLPTDNLSAYWLWCSTEPSTFVCYNIAAIVDIEKGYINYRNGTGIEILNLSNCPYQMPYTINYAKMNQTRHSDMNTNYIERVELAQGQTLQILLRAQDKPPSTTPLHSKSSYTSHSDGASSPTTSILHDTGYSSGATAGMGGASGPILQPSSVLSEHHDSSFHSNSAATPQCTKCECTKCVGIMCTCGHMATTAHLANLPSGTTRVERRYRSSVSFPGAATASIGLGVTSVSSSSRSATTKSSRTRRKAATGKASPPMTLKTSPTLTISTRKKLDKQRKKQTEEEEEDKGSGKNSMVHFKSSFSTSATIEGLEKNEGRGDRKEGTEKTPYAEKAGQTEELEKIIANLRKQAKESEKKILQLERRVEESDIRAQESEKRVEELKTVHDEQWVVRKEDIHLTGPQIGTGGCATVSVAEFRGVQVAVKIMHNEIVRKCKKELFRREMQMAARLRHPNLVQFIGATLQGDMMIVMEYMPTSLRKQLETDEYFQPKIVKLVSLDIARALNYLHKMQPSPMIHRDISSANVLLEPLIPPKPWKAKLTDYCSVNIVRQLNTENPGSPAYSAPEAIIPSQQSPKMDIYSFGVLILEMLTGQLFAPEDRPILFLQVHHEQLLGLIKKCLVVIPENRPNACDIISKLC